MDKSQLEQLIKAHSDEPQFNPIMRVRESFERPGPSLLARLRRFYAETLAVAEEYQDGTDISRWNTVNSFVDMYVGGVRFVIIKASEGLTTDPKFQQHWQGALDAGLIVGVYCFFRGHISGVAQADYFLSVIQPLIDATNGNILPPYLDVESSDGVTVATRRARISEWLTTVKAKFKTPGVYSSPYLWQSLTNNMSITDYWGWVAHWTPYDFTLPGGWSREKTNIHQRGIYPTHSWTTPVGGVSGAIDTNRFFGTYEELQSFAGITQTPVFLPLCVTMTALPTFSEPNVDAPLVGGVQKGQTVTVHAVHRDFVRISSAHEVAQWLPAYALDEKK